MLFKDLEERIDKIIEFDKNMMLLYILIFVALFVIMYALAIIFNYIYLIYYSILLVPIFYISMVLYYFFSLRKTKLKLKSYLDIDKASNLLYNERLQKAIENIIAFNAENGIFYREQIKEICDYYKNKASKNKKNVTLIDIIALSIPIVSMLLNPKVFDFLNQIYLILVFIAATILFYVYYYLYKRFFVKRFAIMNKYTLIVDVYSTLYIKSLNNQNVG